MMEYYPDRQSELDTAKILHIVNVEVVGDTVLRVTFDDEAETTKTVDLAPLLWGVHAALCDRALFRRVRLENGTVFWDYDHGPGYAYGLDFAPEALYDLPGHRN